MTTVPQRVPHTTALVTWLGDAVAPCGDGAKPDGSGWAGAPNISSFVPYLIAHSIPGGSFDGSIEDLHYDAELVWQINSYGSSKAEAEQLADRARVALLAQALPPLAIGGRTVVTVSSEGPAGAARPDTDTASRVTGLAQPSIWWTFERFRIATVPT